MPETVREVSCDACAVTSSGGKSIVEAPKSERERSVVLRKFSPSTGQSDLSAYELRKMERDVSEEDAAKRKGATLIAALEALIVSDVRDELSAERQLSWAAAA